MQKDVPHLTGRTQAGVRLTTAKQYCLEFIHLKGNLTWLWKERLPMAI